MPFSFGVMSGVGQGTGVLDGGNDRRRGRGNLGMNLGRPLCESDALITNYFGRTC